MRGDADADRSRTKSRRRQVALTRIQAHEVLEVGVSGPALRMDIYKLGRRRYALICDVCLIT